MKDTLKAGMRPTASSQTNGKSDSNSSKTSSTSKSSGKFQLEPKLLIQIHDNMVKARVL